VIYAKTLILVIHFLRNLLEVNVQSRIGVTTGQSIVGDVGNRERRESAIVGDIVTCCDFTILLL